MMVGQALKTRLARVVRRVHGRAAMALGRAGSAVPLSKNFGFERGKPIDRHYIEAFLAKHRADIRGRVLEVADDGYSRRYGTGVTSQDVLSLDASNARATLIGDLASGDVLPARRFDCIILTQTLQFIFDVEAAVAHVVQALKPGGVLLVTVPGITPIDHNEWHWSLTKDSLRRLLNPHCDQVSVEAYGNLFAATAFLHGAAVEETDVRKLGRFDPAYPVIVAARAFAR
jgi:SAM-dependent methyltransferase